MGKGDKKSKRGKIIMGSYGVSRKRKVSGATSIAEAKEAKAAKKPAEKKVAEKKPAAKKPAAKKASEKTGE